MLRIAVCDNDALFLEKMRERLEFILINEEVHFEICLFIDASELKRQVLERMFNFDLLYLEWRIREEGIGNLLRLLRGREADCDVILMSDITFPEQSLVKNRVFSCLDKWTLLLKLQEAMGYYLWAKMQYTEYLNISVRGKTESVPLNQIEYLESKIRKVLIYEGNNVTEYYGKLDEAESVLRDLGFIRCHQSFLINRRAVTGINGPSVEVSGKTVPVSRRYSKSVRKSLLNGEEECILGGTAESEAAGSPPRGKIWVTQSLAVNAPEFWEENHVKDKSKARYNLYSI